MFLLSHHHPDEFNRCYRVGPVHLCARCLGTYPVMFLAIALQAFRRAPLDFPGQTLAVLAVTAPALLDWAYGQFHPQAGTNFRRTFTGVLLGLALGRSLYVHLVSPLPFVLLVQLGVVGAVALPVILVSYRRRSH